MNKILKKRGKLRIYVMYDYAKMEMELVDGEVRIGKLRDCVMINDGKNRLVIKDGFYVNKIVAYLENKDRIEVNWLDEMLESLLEKCLNNFIKIEIDLDVIGKNHRILIY